MKLKVPFTCDEIAEYAACYTDPGMDSAPRAAGDAAKSRGYLHRDEFLTITLWKSRRPKRLLERNSDDAIRATTRKSLLCSDPERAVALLSNDEDGLDGVGVRMASAILHLCHRDTFPMLDVRALDALGIPLSQTEKWGEHDFVETWPIYVQACRQFCSETGTEARDLDRALWGYSYDRALKNRLT